MHVDKDTSFQAIAWIKAFVKSKFSHLNLFSAPFGAC